MRLTVIGCGHLGATHAARMAEIGHDVLGVDIDRDKVALLNTGRAWFSEPGLDELLARHDSPGLDVADRLCRLGAEVVVHDPQATGNALVEFPHLGYADSAAGAAHQADAVLVVTAWPEFAALDPAATTAAVSHRLLIDACQASDAMRWRAEGWTVAAPFPFHDHHSERSRLTPGPTPGSHPG